MSDAAPLRDLSEAVDLLLRGHLDALRRTPILAAGRRAEVLQALLDDLGGPLREEVARIPDEVTRSVVEKRVTELEGTLFMALNHTHLAARWSLGDFPEETVEAYLRSVFAQRRIEEAAEWLRSVLRAVSLRGGYRPDVAWPRLLLEGRHLASLWPPAAAICLRQAWEEGVRAKFAPGNTGFPLDGILRAAAAAGVALPVPLEELLVLHHRLGAADLEPTEEGTMEAWELLDAVESVVNALDMTPLPDPVREALARRLG